MGNHYKELSEDTGNFEWEIIESFLRFSEMNFEFMELFTAKGHIRILEKNYRWANRTEVIGKRSKGSPLYAFKVSPVKPFSFTAYGLPCFPAMGCS
jgi:hypothetical protein